MLSKNILNVVSVWEEYKAGKTVNAEHLAHKLIHQNIPACLESWTKEKDRYKFKGSDGEGNILAAPWFAIFDKSITESARDGYYIVYLISGDLKRLVLEIGFGATQFEVKYGRGKKCFDALDNAVINMRVNSKHLADKVLTSTKSRTNIQNVSLDMSGNFLQRAYEHCSIYSITYEIKNLPDEESLKKDYLEYLELYSLMANSLLLAEVDDYVLESVELPRVSDTSLTKDFSIRPQAKKTSKSVSNKSGVYRRSKKSDKIGKLGEEYVFQYEKNKLIKAGFPELASKIIWHRDYAEDRTPGWDITSYHQDGSKKLIEVKASEGKVINEVILTKNEWAKAQDISLQNIYFIYFVTNITTSPEIEIMQNPSKFVSENPLNIQVESYSLSLRESQ